MATNTSSQNIPINQKPPVSLITENITDPTIRYNFTLLNQILLGQQLLTKPPAANLRVSPSWPLNSALPGTFPSTGGIEYQPGPLSQTITTRGNPVQVKLIPVQYAKGGRFFPQFYMVNSSGTSVGVAGGFYRSSLTQSPIQVSRHYPSAQIGSASFVRLPIPLSTFDYTDFNVPSGTWRYQFYLIPDASTSVALYQCCLEVREIR